ncbi:hypothetical protein GmHk_11G032363 [Glycine max]|nr:hypothetical protein GmHk_11G032363 [Glycine max]
MPEQCSSIVKITTSLAKVPNSSTKSGEDCTTLEKEGDKEDDGSFIQTFGNPLIIHDHVCF